VYTALSDIEGLFIRKINWLEILESNPAVASVLISNVMYRYFKDIRCKVLVAKKRAIEEFKQRADHQLIAQSEEFNSAFTTLVDQAILRFGTGHFQ
jgi:CRP-like cAMP-binding protein